MFTYLYLRGLLEHRDRTAWRWRIDSPLILVLYPAGLAVLYFMGR